MNLLKFSAAAVLAASMFAVAPATAAPFSAAPAGVADSVRGKGLKLDVRYGHRACRYHYIPRWGVRAAHRHKGWRNWPVSCRRHWKRKHWKHRHWKKKRWYRKHRRNRDYF